MGDPKFHASALHAQPNEASRPEPAIHLGLPGSALKLIPELRQFFNLRH
jgi:hypothetical protein